MEKPTTESEKLKPISAGDRLWFWFDGPPSILEKNLAELLKQTPHENFEQDNGIYYVKAFSCKNNSASANAIAGGIPQKINSDYPIWIFVLEVDERIEFKHPKPQLSFSNKAAAGDIKIGSSLQIFENETIIILATNQSSYDKDNLTPSAPFQGLGILSLIAFSEILPIELFSSYFCTKRERFINGDLKVKKDIIASKANLKEWKNIVELDISNEKISTSLWFFGKAYSSKDSLSSVVFYNTSLEVISNGNITNYFRSIYKSNKDTMDRAVEAISEIKSVRGNVVHQGLRAVIPEHIPHLCRALLYDGINFELNIKSDEFAFDIISDLLS